MYPINEDDSRSNRQVGIWKQFPGITKLQKLKLCSIYKMNSTFIRALHPSFNITKEFGEDIDANVNGAIPQHRVLQFYGDTGSGKSSSAIAMIFQMFTKDINKIHISMEQYKLIEKAKNAKIGDIMVLDEQPLNVGIGTTREQMQLINLEEVTRKYKLSFIFISPSVRVHKSAHYWLRTIYMDTEHRINRLAVQEPQSQQYLGYIEITIPEDNPFKKLYETEKDSFIEKTLQGKLRGGYLHEFADKILKDKPEIFDVPDGEKKLNKKQIMLIIMREYPSLTTKEIELIVEEVDMIKRGIMYKRKVNGE